MQSVSPERFCDVRAFHRLRHGLLYIRTHVEAEAGEAGALVYGADGPVKVWVNGEEAGCHPEATNPAQANAYSVPVRWREGKNEVLFALATNGGHAWGVFAAWMPE